MNGCFFKSLCLNIPSGVNLQSLMCSFSDADWYVLGARSRKEKYRYLAKGKLLQTSYRKEGKKECV